MSSVRKVPWENSPATFAMNRTSTRIPMNDAPIENASVAPPARERSATVAPRAAAARRARRAERNTTSDDSAANASADGSTATATRRRRSLSSSAPNMLIIGLLRSPS